MLEVNHKDVEMTENDSIRVHAVTQFLLRSIAKLSEVAKRVSNLILYSAFICLVAQVLHLTFTFQWQDWWLLISKILMISGIASTLLLFVIWFIVRGLGMFPANIIELNKSVSGVVERYSDDELKRLEEIKNDPFTLKATFKAGSAVVRALRDVHKVMGDTGTVIRSYAFVLITINPLFWSLLVIVSTSALTIAILTAIMMITHQIS